MRGNGESAKRRAGHAASASQSGGASREERFGSPALQDHVDKFTTTFYIFYDVLIS